MVEVASRELQEAIASAGVETMVKYGLYFPEEDRVETLQRIGRTHPHVIEAKAKKLRDLADMLESYLPKKDVAHG